MKKRGLQDWMLDVDELIVLSMLSKFAFAWNKEWYTDCTTCSILYDYTDILQKKNERLFCTDPETINNYTSSILIMV